MYLDINDDGVRLRQPDVVTDFYASYYDRLAPERLAALLAEHDAELLPDRAHVMVPIASLRRLAAGQVPEGWEDDLAVMLDKARERGWLSEDGTKLRAHLERER